MQDTDQMEFRGAKRFSKKKNSCLICLITGHHAKKCRKYPKYVICEKRHYPIMCVELQKSTKKSEDEKSMLKQSTKQSTVLLQTVKLHLFHEDQVVTVRALLDSGAQRFFIRSDVIDKLKIVPTGNEHLRHNLFGGVCKSLDNKYKLQIEALEQKTICDNLPKVKPGILLSQLQAKGINITDCVDEVTEISLLIGSDVLGSLYTGRSEHVSDNLVVIETKFGWVIQGPTSGMYSIFTSVHACSFDIDDLWKLESIGIKDEAQVKSIRKREEEVENFFRESIVRNDEDRYEIKLPWNDTADLLSPNYNLALKRLHSTTNKLNKLGLLTAYDEVFGEWLDSNIIEEVVDDNPQIGHYLPHQVVVKDSSLTTRIRPVFDASAITKEGVCLNACLEKGSNLIELIPKLLIQFRKGAIGITADIKKAFLQSIHPDDRKFLKFLWWNNPGSADRKLKVFRHRRVVFGVTTSPYLLSATILYHLEKYECEMASLLKNSFYVDNCIVSVNNEVEMEKFIIEALNIMNEGVTWNSQTDELYCKVPFLKQIDKKLTKRVLLSMAQSIFDPIGFLCPTTLIPKLLIQKCWERTMDWDKELTLELEKSAKEWLQQVSSIEKCRIPRRLSKCNLSDCNNTIHTFSDASQYAYSGCVFLRSEYAGVVTVQLVLAKARVTPVKPITMPRLELIAALLATRLCTEAKYALQLNCKEYYWTDSSIVLAWIRRGIGLNVFVHNRIKEITDRSHVDDWHHVPGELNPADLPSRGCNAENLFKSRWWEGPDWLKKSQELWPYCEVPPDESEVNKEIKKTCLTVQEVYRFTDRFLYFGKYSKIVRTVAWCLRFNKYDCNRQNKKDITAEEYEKAENRLLCLIQRETYGDINEVKTRLKLDIFKDSKNIIRVKTRLTLSGDTEDFVTPMLLPGTNSIVKRLVHRSHVLGLHAGTQTLINILREEYWIVGIRKLAKTVVRECIICKRHNVKACTVPLAPLPADRVTCRVPFEVTGVDLAGPLYLKSGDKCWIVVFTCATYRALHLELCSSLSTEEFLLSLKRFIARRGRPRIIYSDNGTNFRGTNNILSTVNWDDVSSKISIQKISWHFIPPQAPWWGGWWERMVRTITEILRRVLGKAALYIEKINTDLQQRFRSEYLSLLVQKNTKNENNLQPGDIVLIGSDDLKRVNWPLGLILEICLGVDNVGRVARVKTAKGERVRALQRLFPLELSRLESIQFPQSSGSNDKVADPALEPDNLLNKDNTFWSSCETASTSKPVIYFYFIVVL
ncbi:uncharacterized protein LOC131842620 [Achroia grisella]|uniref:uncharacterized protein LOC131842620 n=1 Tax=Achroia grisella TaxID=688607 RepID=UPI0027D20B7C|nr:uncharacterized protein LOC131842620 [Achroia grisella]